MVVSPEKKVDQYLQERKEKSKGGNPQRWQQLEELYSKKLWHPLASTLQQCVETEEFCQNENLLEVYNQFIHEFEHRINPLALVQIGLHIARSIADPKESCDFLDKIKTTVKNDKEAVVLCMTGIAEGRLGIRDPKGRCMQITEIRMILEDAEKRLDALTGISVVHGEFHRVNAKYLQEIGNYGRYYKEALRYLGCVKLETLKTNEVHLLAFCLALSALLGEDVYNFGELLAHPILESLSGVKESWIVDLLYAFNAGDMDRFEKMRAKWSGWDDLKKHANFLQQKIRLLSLMEMSFARSAKNRLISFSEISERARIPEDEVEFLVMKALSRGLIRGSIDQVQKLVCISWVQPRVLDSKQIDTMAKRIQEWSGDVASMENLLEFEAKDILTQ